MSNEEWTEKLCAKSPGLREALERVKKTAEPLPVEVRLMIFRKDTP